MIAGVSSLCGCSNSADQARKKFEFLRQQHASLGEICSAATEWRRAIVDRQDVAALSEWQMKAGGACLEADVRGREQGYGMAQIEPDNMDAGVPPSANESLLDNAEIGRNEFQGE